MKRDWARSKISEPMGKRKKTAKQQKAPFFVRDWCGRKYGNCRQNVLMGSCQDGGSVCNSSINAASIFSSSFFFFFFLQGLYHHSATHKCNSNHFNHINALFLFVWNYHHINTLFLFVWNCHRINAISSRSSSSPDPHSTTFAPTKVAMFGSDSFLSKGYPERASTKSSLVAIVNFFLKKSHITKFSRLFKQYKPSKDKWERIRNLCSFVQGQKSPDPSPTYATRVNLRSSPWPISLSNILPIFITQTQHIALEVRNVTKIHNILQSYSSRKEKKVHWGKFQSV